MPAGLRTPEPRIRILVADDHPAITCGLKALFDDQPDMRVVGSAHDAIAALRLPRCDVAVVDYHLAAHDGLWLTLQLKQRPAPPAVLLFSAFSDDVLTVAAAVADADGVLRKSAVGDELCVAIRRLASGGRYLPAVPPSVLRAVIAGIDPEHRAAVQLLAEGRSAATVADQLGLGDNQLLAIRHAAVQRLSPAATRANVPIGPRRGPHREPVAG